MATVIQLPKKATKKDVLEALKKINTAAPKKSMTKHFGALKRGIDGLEYQKKIRNEWS